MSRRLRDAADELAAYRRGVSRAPETPDLFSTIQAVADAAGEVYRQETLQAVYEIAKRRETFTVEHVQPLAPPTIDRRAIGGILLEAQRRGWVSKGPWVGSGAERHGRPVREWHSRIYRGDNDR